MIDLALAACNQRHGALLIITDAAEAEAERLDTQSIPIQPILLTPEMLNAVSSIDGAVLVSRRAICYAVGAIFDGLATPTGDSSRGARFNSSVRYVSGRSECVAIVVSEDGHAQWIPNLIPRLSTKELHEKQSELVALCKGDELDMDRSWKLLRWLREHRFYLAPDVCEAGNKLAARYEQAVRANGGITLV